MPMTFVLSGKTSEFVSCQDSAILDPNTKYEVALLSLDMYNSIPNITGQKNNIFKYTTHNGVDWKIIDLNTGSYELEAINNEIKRQLTANGDKSSSFTITPNIS
jgi:hypothetical protein